MRGVQERQRSEYQRDPRWQNAQRRIALLFWALLLLSPLVLCMPILAARLLPVRHPASTGDKLADALVDASSHARKHAQGRELPGNGVLTSGLLEELEPALEGEPGWNELLVLVSSYDPGPMAAGGQGRTEEIIEKARQSGDLSPELMLIDLQLARKARRAEAIKAHLLSIKEEEFDRQQELAGQIERLEARHEEMYIQSLKQLQSVDQDNAYPLYLEAQAELERGHYDAALILLRKGNELPAADMLPLSPRKQFLALCATGRQPRDQLSALYLSYDYTGLLSEPFLDIYESLVVNAQRDSDLQLMDDLHTYLCRLGRAHGVSRDLSRKCWFALDDLANARLGSVAGGRKLSSDQNAAIIGLRRKLNSLSQQYSVPAYLGSSHWATYSSGAGPQAWLSYVSGVLDEQVRSVSEVYDQAGEYDWEVDWCRSSMPGGTVYERLRELEHFDYRSLNWTADGSGP